MLHAFDERSLIKETIESATGKACDEISSLDLLQKKLEESVLKKKFLLVLDDIWEKDTARLDLLLGPLNQVGEKGSRIILTTRMQKVAEDLNAKPIIHLDDLEDDDCWSILKHYAFDGNEEIIEDHQELKYVGNQIIKKIKNSPLTLKVVGSSLHNKRSVKEWDKILQQEDILKDTMNLLLFSYQCLPLHLQRCFAYCSLFPKGYTFYFNSRKHQPHLIFLWIAQGFIENTNEFTHEEVGQKYIEELISYSFFEKASNVFADYFVIHDLLHDLAEKVSKKQCHRIEHHNSLHVPTTCIHLSLCITENLVSTDLSTILAISDVFSLRNLRSLIVLQLAGYESTFKSKKSIFQNITKLRTLYVENCEKEVLTDPHIDKLRHFRYLHVQYNSKLPASLVKLYQLQFFILITDQEYGNKYLPANTLPQGFNNLTSLRTLRFYDKSGFEELDYLHYNSKMVNIEKLTVLQNLEKFYVDGFNRMKSLRDLPIGGSFSILNLENVKGKQEAEKAMLYQKKNIDELIFVWSSTPSSTDTCEEVLEGLEPYRNLERLEINGYQGVNFPKWMVKENCLPRLRTLRLKSCTIVPFLPPSLELLEVENCHELMQLPPSSDTLRNLTLIRCPKLQALANQSPNLEILKIGYCPNLTIASTFNKSISLYDFSVLTNLKWLTLEGFPNLEALILSPTLICLYIEDCPKLTRLGNLQRCTYLDHLVIRKCPMLRREEASLVEGVAEGDTANRLPHAKKIVTDEPLLVLELVQQQQALSSIKYLTLTDCAAIPNLEMLSSLESLDIKNCPDVEALPNLPISLQCFWTEGCPKLKGKYGAGGPLRNTISHIPQVHIS